MAPVTQDYSGRAMLSVCFISSVIISLFYTAYCMAIRLAQCNYITQYVRRYRTMIQSHTHCSVLGERPGSSQCGIMNGAFYNIMLHQEVLSFLCYTKTQTYNILCTKRSSFLSMCAVQQIFSGTSRENRTFKSISKC